MRAIVFLIPVIFLFNTANAQYEQGDIDVAIGGGGGLYGAKTNDVADTTSGIGAATSLLHFTFNVAVIPRLSLGLDYERSGFYVKSDSASANSDPYANANTFRLNILFRVVNAKRSTLSLRALTGLSMFTFGDRNSDEKIKSNGFTFELGIHYQQLFGKHFGMFQNTAYSYYRYGNITDETGTVWKTQNGNENVVLIISGVNVRLGFVFKF